MYLDLVKLKPLVITRNGVEEAVFIDPASYEYKKKSKKSVRKSQDMMDSAFIGMHKNRKGWKTKTNAAIAGKLRGNAWSGN